MSEAESAANPGISVVDGLRKLAFSPVNDAVLLLADKDGIEAETLAKLDLFMVSEIKQSKDGSIEIKFINRLKAFELLAALTGRQSEDSQAASFINALEEAAKSVCEADEV